MTIYEFEGKRPRIDPSSYLHEKSSIIGDVVIGAQCFIGAGAVIRGDYGRIEIGNRTSVQENCVLHARPNEVCRVGSEVQIGHGAVLHNCEVRDYAVVGLGSRICDYAVIGRWAIVGEGSVVATKSEIPDEKVALGVPARVLRNMTDEEKKLLASYKARYVELAARYKTGLRVVSPE